MTRFYSSDWHLSHTNIIDFVSRPFYHEIPMNTAFGERFATVPDVEAMNKALIDNTNDMVSVDDELWLVGDLAMGRFETSVQLFKQLKCRNLYQIPGNHDRNHKMHPKWRRFQPAYEDAGFTVLDSQVRTTIGDTDVLVCHFPYTGDSHHDDRYSGLRPDDEGGWLIHGHCHGPMRQRGMSIEVGVDPWGGFPVSEDTIESLIAAGPNDLDGIKWETA